MSLEAAKKRARQEGFARRKAAFAAAGPHQDAHLQTVLGAHLGKSVAGYMPINTEIDPLPAMAQAAMSGPVAIPVIEGPGRALRFARWTPQTPLVAGAFKALIPAEPEWLVPEIVIVPLVAFDRRGGRLGYGGGFYDRTLEALRAGGNTLAVGFAFAAQEAEALPLEATDQPLDLIVTEDEIIHLG